VVYFMGLEELPHGLRVNTESNENCSPRLQYRAAKPAFFAYKMHLYSETRAESSVMP
jgi:hypothetical protein